MWFFQDIGVKVKQEAITDYTQDYIPNDRDASGAYEGVGVHSVTGGTPMLLSPISALVALHLPSSGVTFNGYDVNGKGDMSGDPQLISILNKARTEKDVNQQKKLVLDAQRYLGKAQHMLCLPGSATGFWAVWPAVQNFRTYDGGTDSPGSTTRCGSTRRSHLWANSPAGPRLRPPGGASSYTESR